MMSDCNFSIGFTGTPENLVAKAQREITNAKGTFYGDPQKGGFEISTPIGKVTGSYFIKNAGIEITIANKPIFITCNRIEQELQRLLGGS